MKNDDTINITLHISLHICMSISTEEIPDIELLCEREQALQI